MASAAVANSAILFAGQGTDVMKSVQNLITGPWGEEARNYFSRASTVLGYDLLDICLNQPEKLSTTAFSQPAILVATLATVERARCAEMAQASFPPSTGVNIGAVTHAAGFSLGEYTALVFSGALTFEDGVRLIKSRAEGMQTASEETPGSMVTVVGLDDDKLDTLCQDAIAECALSGHVKIGTANHIFPKGRVLSGHKTLCKWVVDNATKPKYGAAMVMALPVAGAFHSSYMASARDGLQAALSEVDISMPRIPVYSNVTARPYGSVEEIRELLLRQLESPVLWEDSIKNMLSEKNTSWTFLDAGPGAQLKGMMRRIDKKASSKTSVLA